MGCLLSTNDFYSYIDFDISEAFVIKIYETESPSCDDAIPSATEVYLVEPFRINSAVIKYSGTLGASHRTDHRSSTLAAFAHFVAQDTACQYVFADIQGMYNLHFSQLETQCADVLHLQ